MIPFLALLACAHRAPPPEPAPVAAGASLIQVEVDPEQLQAAGAGAAGPPSDEARLKAAVAELEPAARSCYAEALKRDPRTYGEVLVRYTVGPGGELLGAEVVLETVGDPALVDCVEGVARRARFPALGGEERVFRYPFLFTSNLTPPEVVRALQLHYGLLPPEPPPTDEDSLVPVPRPDPGAVDTW